MSLDTFLSDLAAIAKRVEPLVSFVAAAQAAVGIGGQDAAKAIAVVEGALKALEQYASGQVTAEQCHALIAAQIDALAANAAGADAILEERFRVPEGP